MKTKEIPGDPEGRVERFVENFKYLGPWGLEDPGSDERRKWRRKFQEVGLRQLSSEIKEAN